MILLIAALVAVGIVALLGGDLSRMAQISIRHGWLAWLAIAVQTALVTWHFPGGLSQGIHLATYVAAGAFAYANRGIAGVYFISAGGLMNFAAIAANQGVMPASDSALKIAGLQTETEFSNSDHVEGAHLQFLGDIFAVPERWPLSNVFSIGDVIVVIGIYYLVYRASQPPSPRDTTAVGLTSHASR